MLDGHRTKIVSGLTTFIGAASLIKDLISGEGVKAENLMVVSLGLQGLFTAIKINRALTKDR